MATTYNIVLEARSELEFTPTVLFLGSSICCIVHISQQSLQQFRQPTKS
jgi:hypothetical protein